MLIYEFAYEGGKALIKEIATGQVVIDQPGLPGIEGIVPWTDETEAREWMEARHGALLNHEVLDPVSEENSAGEENPTDNQPGE
jgi:hypothetical protein